MIKALYQFENIFLVENTWENNCDYFGNAVDAQTCLLLPRLRLNLFYWHFEMCGQMQKTSQTQKVAENVSKTHYFIFFNLYFQL